MAVLALKLINGDEIVGDCTQYGKTYTIKNPALIGIVPNQQGQPGIGLADYLPLADQINKEISLQMDTTILFQYTPSVQMINAYNRMFGNGLVIPTTGLITG